MLQTITTSLTSTLFQLLQLLLALFIANLILTIFEKFRKDTEGIPLTGYIGVPIHELCHAFAALIFRHQIKEIVLLKNPSKDGVLGYVKTSYNERSIWQRIGVFVSAIAPILIGSILLYCGTYYIVDIDSRTFMRQLTDGDLTLSITIASCFMIISSVVTTIFSFNIAGILLFIIMVCTATHMTLSKQDLKNALFSLFTLFFLFFIINLFGFSSFMTYITNFLANFFYITSFISVMYGFIGFFVHQVFCVIRSKIF